MRVSFDLEYSRLICRLTDGRLAATATSALAAEAAAALLAALQDARETGLGECFWHEQGGDYRWMLCRHGENLDVALMWCSGVCTGWQHVFRAESPLESFTADVHEQLRALAAPSA